MIFDDPPWLLANPAKGRSIGSLALQRVFDAYDARRRSPATGTAKMDNSKSEPTKPHVEATSALRTYAITLRRNADKNDGEIRKLAQEIAKLSASADQMRAEAAAYDDSADCLDSSNVEVVISCRVDGEGPIAEKVAEETRRMSPRPRGFA